MTDQERPLIITIHERKLLYDSVQVDETELERIDVVFSFSAGIMTRTCTESANWHVCTA